VKSASCRRHACCLLPRSGLRHVPLKGRLRKI